MKSKRNLLVVIAMLVMMAGTGLAYLIANVQSERNVRERARDLLAEDAAEQSTTLGAIVEGQFKVLELAASMFETSDKLNDDEIIDFTEAISATTEFTSVNYITAEGSILARDDSYEVENVADRRFFKDVISGKCAFESDVESAGRGRVLVLAVPCYEQGEIVAVLSGSYSETALRELLSDGVHNTNRYTYIIDVNGNVIVDLSKLDSEENVRLETLTDTRIADGYTFDGLLAAIRDGGSGAFAYTHGGYDSIAAFAPLASLRSKDEFLYLLTAIPANLLRSDISVERSGSRQILFIFVFCSTIAVLLLTLSAGEQERALAHEAEEMRVREEQYKIVVEQSGRNALRYDIPGRRYIGDASETMDPARGLALAGIECDSSQKSFIDRASLADYQDFFRRISVGETPLTVDIQVKDANGGSRWYRYNSTTQFTDMGQPRTAIISYYDCTSQREREAEYERWRKSAVDMPTGKSAAYEWNLSRDVPGAALGDSLPYFDPAVQKPFNEHMREYAEKYVDEKQRSEFIRITDRERLIGVYHDGAFHEGMDYREIQDNGRLVWMRFMARLLLYDDSDDIRACVTFANIDVEKRAELERQIRAEQDALTGTFNREALQKRIEKALRDSPNSNHVFMSLDVDGLRQVNEQLGYAAGDEVLRDSAGRINSALHINDVYGRIGGDKFLVFMPDMPYEAAISVKADRLCAALYRRLNDQIIISASIGIAVYPRDGTSLDELLKKADAALSRVKLLLTNSYAFYSEDMTAPGLSEIYADSSAAMKARHNRKILIASDSEELCDEVAHMVSESLGAMMAHGLREANDLIKRYQRDISMIVLDADCGFGPRLMSELCTGDGVWKMPLLALTADADPERMLGLVEGGAIAVVLKPVDRRTLMARIAIIQSIKESVLDQVQRGYQRLQGSEEERYHELLSATGTAMFIYDADTQSYISGPLVGSFIAGNFDGRPLFDVLSKDGVLSAEDALLFRELAEQVVGDKRQRAEMTALFRTPTGELRWFLTQFIMLKSEYDVTRKMLITITDVNAKTLADEALRYRAERDTLTGLYNRETFFEKVRELVLEREPGYYVLACMDIDGFKFINDQYGTAEGDHVLQRVADVMSANFDAMGGVCCRVSTDNFAVVYPGEYDDTGRVNAIYDAIVDCAILPVPVVFSIGRYRIVDPSLPVASMYDRALLAKASIKGRYDVHSAYFDESMRLKLLETKEITDGMDVALKNGEFKVWFQPQYDHDTGARIGAEALVRWVSDRKGVIQPGAFIRVFERNGFIYSLDRYVWERTCALLRKWLDEGRDPLPVSVNVSRYDVFQAGFYETLTGYVEKYALPVDLLRLEITESAFAQSSEQIISMVKRLKAYGFVIEIDDFGSGYSSLNTLKDVPADVLKLDIRFMENSDNQRRGGTITESIIRMAKWLGMQVIAEGVETERQADYLLSIGCPYIQGYLHGRPMPLEDYERLMSTGTERRASGDNAADMFDSSAFWDPESLETLIFNSYVGGASVFEYAKGRFELLRINDKYVKELGGDMNVMEALSLRLREHLDVESLRRFREYTERAVATCEEQNFEVEWIDDAPDIRQYIEVSLRMIAKKGDSALIYSTIRNVTAQKQAERRLLEVSEQLATMEKSINGGLCALTLDDGKARIFSANEKYYVQRGITRERFVSEGADAFSFVHTDDLKRVRGRFEQAARDKQPYTLEYRIIRHDNGETAYIRSNIAVTKYDGVDTPVHMVVSSDITSERIGRGQA